MCGKSRTGRFQLKRITIAGRLRATLAEVKAQQKRRMHEPVPEQGRWLASVVRGHMAYYAVPSNVHAVAAFRDQVTRHWHKALRRRSHAPDHLGTDETDQDPMATASPRDAPLPERALRRQNPRQEPGAVVPHAGICAGGRPQGRSLPRRKRRDKPAWRRRWKSSTPKG